MVNILQLTIDEAKERGLPISNQALYTKLNGETILIHILDKNGNAINNQKRSIFGFGKNKIKKYTKKEIEELREQNVIIKILIKGKIKYDVKKQRKILGKPLEKKLKKYGGGFNISYFCSKDKKCFDGFEVTCWNIDFIPLGEKEITEEFRKFLKDALSIITKNLKEEEIKFKIVFAGNLKGTFEKYCSNMTLK